MCQARASRDQAAWPAMLQLSMSACNMAMTAMGRGNPRPKRAHEASGHGPTSLKAQAGPSSVQVGHEVFGREFSWATRMRGRARLACQARLVDSGKLGTICP